MRNRGMLGLVGISIFILVGCATVSPDRGNNDEQVDLYLSTLDDKHFVWCELDLEQCRKDFEKWKRTPRGRAIISEYEKEDTGQTYNRHHVPNVFRTRFVKENRLIEQGESLLHEEIEESSQIYGPELP